MDSPVDHVKRGRGVVCGRHVLLEELDLEARWTQPSQQESFQSHTRTKPHATRHHGTILWQRFPLASDGQHVRGQVDANHLSAEVTRHVEVTSADTTTDVQHLQGHRASRGATVTGWRRVCDAAEATGFTLLPAARPMLSTNGCVVLWPPVLTYP